MHTSSTPQAVEHIVVGFDLDALGVKALDVAVEIARNRGNVQVHAVHVRPPRVSMALGFLPVGLAADETATTKARVDAAVAARVGEPSPELDVVPCVRDGECGDVLVEEARAVDAALVVVGTHRRNGFVRFLEGSVAEQVVRRAPCPVLVVHVDDRAQATEEERDEVLIPPLMEPDDPTTL